MGNHSDTAELLEMARATITSVKQTENPDVLIADDGQTVALQETDITESLPNPKGAKDSKGNNILFDNPPAKKRPKGELRGIRPPRNSSK